MIRVCEKVGGGGAESKYFKVAGKQDQVVEVPRRWLNCSIGGRGLLKMWKGSFRWVVIAGVVPADPLPFRSVPFVIGIDTFVVGGNRGVAVGDGNCA